VSQIGKLLLSKCTLTELRIQLIVKQDLKDNPYVFNVILQCLTKNQDVIHKNQDKFPHTLAKYCIHETLKRSRCISEPKWHHSKLKMTMVCFKGSLGFIYRNHLNLMKTRSKVYGGEVLDTYNLIKELINDGRGNLFLTEILFSFL
jgi:hypothetical protein